VVTPTKEQSDLGRALAALRKKPGNHKLKPCSKCDDRSCDECRVRESKRIAQAKYRAKVPKKDYGPINQSSSRD
jgi:hypothetical protein